MTLALIKDNVNKKSAYTYPTVLCIKEILENYKACLLNIYSTPQKIVYLNSNLPYDELNSLPSDPSEFYHLIVKLDFVYSQLLHAYGVLNKSSEMLIESYVLLQKHIEKIETKNVTALKEEIHLFTQHFNLSLKKETLSIERIFSIVNAQFIPPSEEQRYLNPGIKKMIHKVLHQTDKLTDGDLVLSSLYFLPAHDQNKNLNAPTNEIISQLKHLSEVWLNYFEKTKKTVSPSLSEIKDKCAHVLLKLPSSQYDLDLKVKIQNSTKSKQISQNNITTKKIIHQNLKAQTKANNREKTELRAAEKLEAQKLEAQKLEAQKLEAQKLEAQKLEAQKLEAQKLELEKIAKRKNITTKYCINIPDYAQKIMLQLEENGFKVCIVGGYPRDVLFNVEPDDIDMVTNCPKDKIKDLISHADLRQNPHEPHYFKIKSTDNTLNIDIACIQEPLKEYLLRKDFGLNTLTCEKDGKVLDRLKIIQDVDSKTWTPLSEANNLFSKHPDMILRGIRLSHHINVPLPKNIILAMQNQAIHIRDITFGIYLNNLSKLFLRGKAIDNLFFLIQNKILSNMIPFLTEKESERYLLYWQNLLAPIDEMMPNERKEKYNPTLIFALLLRPVQAHLTLFFDEYSKISIEDKNLLIKKISRIYQYLQQQEAKNKPNIVQQLYNVQNTFINNTNIYINNTNFNNMYTPSYSNMPQPNSPSYYNEQPKEDYFYSNTNSGEQNELKKNIFHEKNNTFK